MCLNLFQKQELEAKKRVEEREKRAEETKEELVGILFVVQPYFRINKVKPQIYVIYPPLTLFEQSNCIFWINDCYMLLNGNSYLTRRIHLS